ncbi:MAG: MFS transporter [Pseudomonadota bacterium]
MSYRTLLVLTVAQSFGHCATPIVVLLGGIVGAQLAPSLNWATLPVATLIIGVASATIPAALLMSRVGRRKGFITGTLIGIGGALFGATAVWSESFVLLCLGAFFIGHNAAFMQQFRFAVAESVPQEKAAKAISVLMLAGIVAAVLGPEVARRCSVIGEWPVYVGSFVGMAVLLSLSLLILVAFYRDTPTRNVTDEFVPRPLGAILAQPRLILAIAAAAVAYSVMSLIMTATPLSMHEMDAHTLDATTWVIQSHILAMYVPSLFSGVLISWFGVRRIIFAGFASMIACVCVGWGEPQLMHYWGTMVLLGIGWNFLFLGGTTLLTQTYHSAERFKVQAVNDFLVFGLQALGSIGAGVLLAGIGWNGVMAFTLPWLGLLMIVIVVAGKATRPAAT